MRVRTVEILLLIAVAWAVGGGCTHNNGDIGPYFGSWLLAEIKANGVTDADYTGNVVWAFQSDVVKMTVVYPWHETSGRFGTWSEHDGYLELDYTHSSDDMGSGTGDYCFPPGLHLPDHGRVRLHIESLTAKNMVLGYSNDGVEYTYYLKKQF